jgi:hypothetical protein
VVAVFRVQADGAVSGLAIAHPDTPRNEDDGRPHDGFERCVRSALSGLTFSKQRSVTSVAALMLVRVEAPQYLPPPHCDPIERLDTASVEVENGTQDTIVFAWAGPVASSATISAGSRMERELPQGSYLFTVRDVSSDSVSPLYLRRDLANGYGCVWGIRIQAR